MSNLFKAYNDGGDRTWNGMKTNTTSLSPIVDLFYNIAAARGKFDTIKPLLAAALGSDKDKTIRIALWARDVRQGAGERQTFRDTINFMAENEMITIDEAKRIMVKIPELGRWDDMKVFVDTVLEHDALSAWWAAIIAGDSLAAKWAPRKGLIANKLRKVAGLSPKEYRKLVVKNTQVVEQQMCAKEWKEINFSHVPSIAASRYQKAFNRNAPVEYAAYKAELVKPQSERDPNVKINADAIYPYNIVQAVASGDATVASEQWKALPDYMEGSYDHKIMPLIDTSGSMTIGINGEFSWSRNHKYISCMDVAISLGIYISERNVGPFKDEFITFQSSPKMFRLTGDLKHRVYQAERAPWGGSTNVIAAFKLIVDAAKKHNLPQEDVPRTLLIISDMQFNDCVHYDDSAMESVHRQFRDAGYEPPNVVFWNLNSKGNGVPTTADKFGTALVSGFSPSIMKSILKADDFTPEAIMNQTIMSNRYDW